MNFPKDFLSISDLSAEQIADLLELAKEVKTQRHSHPKYLQGKSIGILTSKPSLRTRLSFEVGLMELGAQSLFIKNDEVGLGERESYADIARVISRYFAAFVVRTHEHKGLIELAKYSSIPIVNALSDSEHPCQILADFLTVKETFGKLKGVKLCYIGDGNNVAVSLMLGSALTGIEFSLVAPSGYEPPKNYVDLSSHLAKRNGSPVPNISNDLAVAAEADILYTDVWISMGQESTKEKVKKTFEPYQINKGLTGSRNIPVLHCLPAHREEEITEEVFEQNAKLIFDQAENRLHAQKALLIKLLR